MTGSTINEAARRRFLGIFMAVAMATFAVAGSAIGGHLLSGVKSYTGCLATQGGTLTLVREGSSPAKACPGGSVEAHFSGGDITGITAGFGLSGGGTNGDVTLSLDPKYALSQDCATGQVVKWNGTAWACADDNDTTYAAGDGLALDGTTLSVDPDYQLPQDCALGESPVWTSGISVALPEWGCRRYAVADQDCASGKFANGIDAQGDVKCATPGSGAGGLPSAWTAFEIDDAPQGFYNEVVGLDLPAGSFLLFVSGEAGDDGGGNGEVDVTCKGDQFSIRFFYSSDGPVPSVTISMQSSATLAQPSHVAVECKSSTGSDHVALTLTALQVGAINP